MNKFLAFAIALGLVACGGTNPTTSDTPTGPLTLEKTPVGTVSGTASTVAIGAAGGSISNSSAGAKVIVPAGAMPDGSSLSLEAILNPAIDAKPGIRLSGSEWTKPITIQFSYPASITDPENYMVIVQTPIGTWVTSNTPKIDAVNRTVSIRLGAELNPVATKSGSAKIAQSNLKATAKPRARDILFTKKFIIEPQIATVKCGSSVKFTAYNRVAVDKKEAELTPNELDIADEIRKEKFDAFNEANAQSDYDNDVLVPLATTKYVMQLRPVPSSKGTWSSSGPGSLSADGTFTAPKKTTDGVVVAVYFLTETKDKNGLITFKSGKARVLIECDQYSRNGGF
jgi:hypothetical protein